MKHHHSISPNRRVEYDFNQLVATKNTKLQIGFVCTNGVKISFFIMDLSTNLVIYSVKKKVDFVAEINLIKKEKIRFIFVNENNNSVKIIFKK